MDPNKDYNIRAMWARLKKEEPATMENAQIFSYAGTKSSVGTALNTTDTAGKNIVVINSLPGSIISSVKISNRADSYGTGMTRVVQSNTAKNEGAQASDGSQN